MLSDKVVIYDDSCPMCRLYTYWFVAFGFLKAENRIGFATAPSEITQHIDLDRGRHEIPLFDKADNSTTYGLKALTSILASRWKWMEPAFESKIFWMIFYPLYQIITFNRRVIAGCKHCCGFDCAPDFNLFYRSLYLALASSFVTFIVAALGLAGGFPGTIATATVLSFLIVGIVCGLIGGINDSNYAWDYAGNFVTVLVVISILMSPLVIFGSPPEFLTWLTILVATMFGLEEIRRREL